MCPIWGTLLACKQHVCGSTQTLALICRAGGAGTTTAMPPLSTWCEGDITRHTVHIRSPFSYAHTYTHTHARAGSLPTSLKHTLTVCHCLSVCLSVCLAGSGSLSVSASVCLSGGRWLSLYLSFRGPDSLGSMVAVAMAILAVLVLLFFLSLGLLCAVRQLQANVFMPTTHQIFLKNA